jgi:hypothetical protein
MEKHENMEEKLKSPHLKEHEHHHHKWGEHREHHPKIQPVLIEGE